MSDPERRRGVFAKKWEGRNVSSLVKAFTKSYPFGWLCYGGGGFVYWNTGLQIVGGNDIIIQTGLYLDEGNILRIKQ